MNVFACISNAQLNKAYQPTEGMHYSVVKILSVVSFFVIIRSNAFNQ